MQTFTGFIRDDRYETPTVIFFMARGEDQAREIARGNLHDYPHHQAFEIRNREQGLIFIEHRDPPPGP